ncbi:Crp/Fnr family transcriptional regulator [Draconibacterium mangrovi]|uniref:Crp/Fnr family transcriptional regulator n=1 Tax=Draconibacterium mangrovi TaxID=2697469 RepID=UPI0013D73A8F|nr:Crp/Fnr family transcriptional regulator [Draconibacterium mangrovi]
MLIESLHNTEIIKKGEFFLKYAASCKQIGRLKKGVLRGFVIDADGNEITTHFYGEDDMVIGSFVPNMNAVISIQALTNCEIYKADYSTIMSYVNKDKEITEVITSSFQKLNAQLQSRLVALLNLNSLERYKLFLQEYPNLINRIPHYYIANFLGITPTQLSRARKQFINNCK